MKFVEENDREAIHSFIMKLYFKDLGQIKFEEYHLKLNYHDRALFKWFWLPKRVYRKYELIAIQKKNGKQSRVRIPFKEKDSVKYFVNLISK